MTSGPFLKVYSLIRRPIPFVTIVPGPSAALGGALYYQFSIHTNHRCLLSRRYLGNSSVLLQQQAKNPDASATSPVSYVGAIYLVSP